MNQAKFKISLDDSIKYLKIIELFKERGVKDIGKHSSEFKKVSRKKNHGLIHEVAIQNLDWEIILEDNSLYQFTFDDDNCLRYSFIQNPNTFVNKIDYLRSLFEDDDVNENYDELLNDIKEEEFEQFQLEQGINSEAHIIRYDYDVKGYKKLIHSVSHIHIGFSKSLRIPVKTVLSPLEFVFFTIRHSYSAYWESSFTRIEDFIENLKKEKKACTIIDSEYWHSDEESDLYIN